MKEEQQQQKSCIAQKIPKGNKTKHTTQIGCVADEVEIYVVIERTEEHTHHINMNSLV